MLDSISYPAEPRRFLSATDGALLGSVPIAIIAVFFLDYYDSVLIADATMDSMSHLTDSPRLIEVLRTLT